MNPSESAPPEQRTSALQVEVRASRRMFHIDRSWPLIFLAGFAIVGTGGAALLAQRDAAQQPKITWSENQIEIILSPGESASRDLTFTSSLDVENIVIEPVPELAPFITVQPNSFANVPAGQQQAVTLRFSISADATLGDYDGTIHVRLGSQTLPQTLKVVFNVWQVFRNPDPDLGFVFYFPPTLALRQGFAANEVVLALPGSEGQFPEISFESFSRANTDSTALDDTLRHSNVANLQMDDVVVGTLLGRRFSGNSLLSDGTQWKVTRVLVITASRIYLISADNADLLLDQILPTVLLN